MAELVILLQISHEFLIITHVIGLRAHFLKSFDLLLQRFLIDAYILLGLFIMIVFKFFDRICILFAPDRHLRALFDLILRQSIILLSLKTPLFKIGKGFFLCLLQRIMKFMHHDFRQIHFLLFGRLF